MPDWDEDSPQLRENLNRILRKIVAEAPRREQPNRELARQWQSAFMAALNVSNPLYIGAYRGEPGLERTGVSVGNQYGVSPLEVHRELSKFEAKLQALVEEMDRSVPVGQNLGADELEAIIDLCAWVHAEWIRIHPFANGNGRTARLWANWIAIRYGLPPFVRLRPRPDGGYGNAGYMAMQGDWKPTAAVFRRLFDDFLTGA